MTTGTGHGLRRVLVALRATFLTVLLFILATPAIQAARSRSGTVFTAERRSGL